MSNLTTYRWNPDAEIEKVWRVMRVQALHDDLVRDGILVPDTRLQDIADAWNEGNTEPISAGIRVAHKSVRDWWPEVATLLDALGGAGDDPVCVGCGVGMLTEHRAACWANADRWRRQ